MIRSVSGAEKLAETSSELAELFQQESSPAIISSPKGRRRQLRVGQVLFTPYSNGAPQLRKTDSAPEKATDIRTYNADLIRSILSLKGLIMSSADEQIAYMGNNERTPLPRTWIEQYIHPDLKDVYFAFTLEVNKILRGVQDSPTTPDNCFEIDDRLLNRGEAFEAIDMALSNERFADVAAVVDAHWQHISGKGQQTAT